ncbi:MAG: D-glycero-beta-D-manno-heptose-7-phosphate kinase [Pyrinomonadaceae bacterium]|nr:D-glycero-beta-D-manno-heptose-7-phosphate kinase [Pyrinomonadaceae bacterium]
MNFLEKISQVRVLVIGDVMLDRYWWGNVSRVSPEAPVPIVDLKKISSTVGGAANVAANIAGLGAEAFLVGVVGDDEEADSLLENLAAKNVSTDFLVKSSKRCTTVKTRIIAHHQQLARIDREIKDVLSAEDQENVWRFVLNLLNTVEVVVVSDYGKGVVSEKLLSRLITTCRNLGRIILIDPKGKNYSKYRGATMLTPNRFEAAEACGSESYNQSLIEENGNHLLKQLSLKYLLITQGEDGMTLFEKDREAVHLPVESKNVFDVTGAGDTVIACLAAAIGAGATFLEAAKFANRAAGLVIEQIGTTAITLEMLDQTRG